MQALLRRLAGFGLVGGIGFVVDAGLLALLTTGAGLDPFSARLIAISLAALTTWRLNRAVTFGASGRSQVHEGMRYGVVAASVAGLNYAIYSAAILLAGLAPLIALVIASGLATVISYLAYSRLVFARAKPT